MDKTDSYQATLRFRVEEFSKLEDITLSPIHYIRNLPWRILIMPKKCNCPSHPFCYDWLGFFVQCNGGTNPFWSCYADLEMRLLCLLPGVEAFSIRTQHLFSKKENDWGFSHFTGWNDVLNPDNGYIENDTITLEVHVVTYPHLDPKYELSDCFKQEPGEDGKSATYEKVLNSSMNLNNEKSRSEAVFRFKVHKISRFSGCTISPPCYIQNLRWKMKVMKKCTFTPNNVIHSWLGFYLQCDESKSATWFCSAEAELRLLSAKHNVQPFVRKIKHLFHSEENDWGFAYYIGWKDILDPRNGYIKDDAITLEVYIKAAIPFKLCNGIISVENQMIASSTNDNSKKRKGPTSSSSNDILDENVNDLSLLKKKHALTLEFNKVLEKVESFERFEYVQEMLNSVMDKWGVEDSETMDLELE